MQVVLPSREDTGGVQLARTIQRVEACVEKLTHVMTQFIEQMSKFTSALTEAPLALLDTEPSQPAETAEKTACSPPLMNSHVSQSDAVLASNSTTSVGVQVEAVTEKISRQSVIKLISKRPWADSCTLSAMKCVFESADEDDDKDLLHMAHEVLSIVPRFCSEIAKRSTPTGRKIDNSRKNKKKSPYGLYT